jgi:hypothetical protein
MFYLLKHLLLLYLVLSETSCNNIISTLIMSLYASYVCSRILASSRITQSESWMMDPSFQRGFCHRMMIMVLGIVVNHDPEGL